MFTGPHGGGADPRLLVVLIRQLNVSKHWSEGVAAVRVEAGRCAYGAAAPAARHDYVRRVRRHTSCNVPVGPGRPLVHRVVQDARPAGARLHCGQLRLLFRDDIRESLLFLEQLLEQLSRARLGSRLVAARLASRSSAASVRGQRDLHRAKPQIRRAVGQQHRQRVRGFHLILQVLEEAVVAHDPVLVAAHDDLLVDQLLAVRFGDGYRDRLRVLLRRDQRRPSDQP